MSRPNRNNYTSAEEYESALIEYGRNLPPIPGRKKPRKVASFYLEVDTISALDVASKEYGIKKSYILTEAFLDWKARKAF